jgi:hypothetical protein
LAGTPPPDDLDGADLSPILRGEGSSVLADRAGIFVENLNPHAGAGTEYRMIRSLRYKYIAFNEGDDLAFDLLEDPHEQCNLIGRARGEVADELERLRAAIYADFSFATAIGSLRQQRAEFSRRYPSRIASSTSNQIMRGDGVLVEADQPLYYPDIASEDPRMDFADCPQERRASRRVRWTS